MTCQEKPTDGGTHWTTRPLSSGTNVFERWFKELTDRMLRRGVFTCVTSLETAILDWAEHWNSEPKTARLESHPPARRPPHPCFTVP